MKHLAIIVGHNDRAQGAQRVDTGETEFAFNSRVALAAQDYAAVNYPAMTVSVINRLLTTSNRQEIQNAYARADEIGADAVIELHFNSFDTPAAGGCEVLHAGSERGKALAQDVYDRILRAFPDLRKRGLKVPSGHHDGLTNVTAGIAPACLTEPFFGSNPDDCEMFDAAGEAALARAYINGAADYFDGMHPGWDQSAPKPVKKPKPLPWWQRLINLLKGA